MNPERQIILDTETTGLEPKEGHRVIEIGCVEIINRRKTEATFHVYLNPERDVEDGAFDVHGLSNEFLADKPRFSEIDILDRFFRRRLPVLSFPVFDPVSNTIFHVHRIGGQTYPAWTRKGFQGLDRGRQFHAVIGGIGFSSE